MHVLTPSAGGENMTSQPSMVNTTKRFPVNGCCWARWTVMSQGAGEQVMRLRSCAYPPSRQTFEVATRDGLPQVPDARVRFRRSLRPGAEDAYVFTLVE